MSASSNWLEAQVLNHTLRNTAMTQPAGLYVALFTNTSGNALTNLEAGTLTDEISGGSYARQSVAFAAASTAGDGTTTATTSATVTFPTATANWGSVTSIAIMDAATGGHVLYYGNLQTAKSIDAGDSFQLTSGNLTVALA